MLSGKHLIDGAWVEGGTTFKTVSPATGEVLQEKVWDADQATVALAAEAAERAFAAYSATSTADRAKFLRTIADEIEARGAALTETANKETALPEARLNGERGRTTGQLRLFADWIEEGSCFDVRIDRAMPDRQPLPRPDVRLMLKAIGPVGVFGASNFPLAFSTAGGDTASALAAGCPVVVKGHPAHAGTAELVAEAIRVAIEKCGMPSGTFGLVQGASQASGGALVTHPLIKAIGFTGSLRGGRALFDLAVSRPEPIPFYGELGSVNPTFLMPAALSARAAEVGAGWAQSLTMGVGQFCTNPGLVIAIAGPDLDTFTDAACEALGAVPAQTMLTAGIAKAYQSAIDARIKGGKANVKLKGVAEAGACDVSPAVFEVDSATWLANPDLHEEVFGPSAVIVACPDASAVLEVAKALEGQLTATFIMDDADLDAVLPLLPVVERKAGRLMRNNFPTGVEVCHAMMHGGPYPASTDVRSTSVGTKAIERFLRPVAFQNFLQDMLPEAARDGSSVPHLDNGKRS
ncbi:aldehyde dehydrogenase (NADP(+)) [Roseibium litorale]|uniref:Aldehyde dehydrogenase (NADP(+)) n=1 Tax=Roseibium litorale TaxID=2803841 RepID=A0ABR9CTZ7_9HYPH|nr:aldehyde dehydrogenase (NADP(+)) [Roseibium litorale]MBD8893772.1 aldehyde dehydrogenase (NADP(+)) [Roseibium litorale]